MFSPSSDDVRRFFVDAWAKRRAGTPATPIETAAADWVAAHPEHHDALAELERALGARYDSSDGRANPFLHLSMHLSISEQVSIDQPAGIRQAYKRLVARTGTPHEAQHEVMECLGQMLWDAQRSGAPPDGEAYVECVRRRATATR